MPRFEVSVTKRDPAPSPAGRPQKCKCSCAPTLGFDVSVTARDPAPSPAGRAQKCKCKCVQAIPGPWSRVLAESTGTATNPRATELSPLSD
jgi:hypothetical protein